MSEEQKFSIEIDGGVTVCVPADIDLMTPYILLEQEDWFEDEIKFVRAFLKPGMRVIDIGVNYGTYFLTAAKQIGETGKVWGFEPSTQCCAFLEYSIAENGFRNTQMIQAGLSDRIGKAYLSLGENTELNTVSENLEVGEIGESIELLTLDHCLEKMDLKDIDFVKMDAEGEESNIILGGKKFFEINSPLVLFELKHADQVNHKLIGEFNEIGYQAYRLVPGLHCLTPFGSNDPVDRYQLNLFAIKGDRAEQLRASGRIPDTDAFKNDVGDIPLGIWQEYLSQFPFAQELAIILGDDLDRSGEKEFSDFYRALDLFAYSQDPENAMGLRLASLNQSYQLLEAQMRSQGNWSTALTLIRVASTLGKRQQAVDFVSMLIDSVQRRENIILPVPFLMPCAEFDSITFNENLEQWLYSSIFASFQKYSSFSSYYKKPDNIGLLELIESFDYFLPEIRRRNILSKLRFRQELPNELVPITEKLTRKTKNSVIWKKLIE